MSFEQWRWTPAGTRLNWRARVLAATLGLLVFALSSVVASAQSIKVAAVDFVPAWGDLDGNINRLAEAAEKAGEQGINYAVFPETAVSGYLFSDPAQIAPALQRARESVRKLRRSAVVNIWVDPREYAPGTKNQTMYK